MLINENQRWIKLWILISYRLKIWTATTFTAMNSVTLHELRVVFIVNCFQINKKLFVISLYRRWCKVFEGCFDVSVDTNWWSIDFNFLNWIYVNRWSCKHRNCWYPLRMEPYIMEDDFTWTSANLIDVNLICQLIFNWDLKIRTSE